MATWTVSTVDQTCGSCGAVIPPDQPIALFTIHQRVRCQACARANGVAVDDRQVDDARFEIERQRRLELEKPLTPEQYVARARTTRVPAPRKLTPASELAESFFDPKAAAAGSDR